MNKVLIKDIPLLDRPRERFIKRGVNNLSNEELLSIVLKNGVKGYSVKELSYNILKNIKDITDLKNISLNQLTKIKGIGKIKAITLLSSIELGKRVYEYKDKINIKFRNTKDIYNYMKNKLSYKKQEYFYVLYLDSNLCLLEDRLLFIGTVNKANVHPRELFKYAYINSAVSIVLVHNHPSNNIIPSKDDIILTKKIIELSNLSGFKVIDHIIIGNNNYYSFYENNDL